MSLSSLIDNGGGVVVVQRGKERDKYVKSEPDGSWGVEDETRRYSYPESSGKNWVQTELQRYNSHGRRGSGLDVSV